MLHEIEDEDARAGEYAAFPGVLPLLAGLPPDARALVTSNYEHRVRLRFERLGLPMPDVLVDAAGVARGKPDPEGYLAAADRLGRRPEDCLVVEDAIVGVRAGVAAGMEVWSVHMDPAVAERAGARRRYETIAAAADDVRTWLTLGGGA